jgi:hypothetical protein
MGRTPVLTELQMVGVGGECARLWSELAERAGMAEYHARPYLQDVRQIQEGFALVPVASRQHRVHQNSVRTEGADISEMLSNAKVEPVRIKRPYGLHTEVLDAAIKWCAATYGRTITQRRAQACWDTFSATEKRIKRDLP